MAQVDHRVAQAEALGEAAGALAKVVAHLAALQVEPVDGLSFASNLLEEAAYQLAKAAKAMRHDAQRKAAEE